MVIVPTIPKVNKAKKSTGKVTFAPQQGLYAPSGCNNDGGYKGLAESYSPMVVDPMEEILEKSSAIRDTTKMSNLDPFIIVCQEEKLTKTQLDHLSKQWEIYELFIKELELLSKKLTGDKTLKPKDRASDSQSDYKYSSYNGNKDVGILTNKRIRKPKMIYSPPHSMSNSYTGIDESLLFDDEDNLQAETPEIKPKKKFLPKLKLLSNTSLNSPNKVKKATSAAVESLLVETQDNETHESEPNDLVEFYYGNRAENINNLTMDRLKSQKSPIIMKCSKCDHSFTDNIAAMLHALKHIQPEYEKVCLNEKRCQHCFRAFSTLDDTHSHVIKVHKSAFNSGTMCMLCEIHFPTSDDLKRHMTRLHGAKEMPFWCQLCEAHSSSYDELLNHFRSEHSNTNYLMCPFCLIVVKTPFPKAGTPARHAKMDIFETHLEKHFVHNTSASATSVQVEGNSVDDGISKDEKDGDQLQKVAAGIPTHLQCSLCRLSFCHDTPFAKHRDTHHKPCGNDSFHKNTILPIQLPTKLNDIWACYSDIKADAIDGIYKEREGEGKNGNRDTSQRGTGPDEEKGSTKRTQSYASTKVIRKPLVDLRRYMQDEEGSLLAEDQGPEGNDGSAVLTDSDKKGGPGLHQKYAHHLHRRKGSASGVVGTISKSVKQAQKKRQELAAAAVNRGRRMSKKTEAQASVSDILDKRGRKSNEQPSRAAKASVNQEIKTAGQAQSSSAPKFHVAPEIIVGQTCLECKKIIRNSDHYRRRKRCKVCEYSTCCYKALDRHQKNKANHFSPGEKKNRTRGYMLNDGGYALLATMPEIKLSILDDYFVRGGIAIKCPACDSTFYDQNFFMDHLSKDETSKQTKSCRTTTYKIIPNPWLTEGNKNGLRRKIPMGSANNSPRVSILKRNASPRTATFPAKKLKVEFDASTYEVESNSQTAEATEEIIDGQREMTKANGETDVRSTNNDETTIPAPPSFNPEDFAEAETPTLAAMFQPLDQVSDTEGKRSSLADLMTIITEEPGQSDETDELAQHINLPMPLTDDSVTATTDSTTTLNP